MDVQHFALYKILLDLKTNTNNLDELSISQI